MTPAEFIEKWRAASLNERQTAHEHFVDLCRLFEHPTPAEGDPSGETYAFEKGASKTGGGEGFADVWKRGFFAWEYKKKKRNLDQAMDQLVRYAAALENPPLQVACDIDRIRIRTAWTNLVSRTVEIPLEDLGEPENLARLHAVFHDPDALKPERTRERVTREAADKFSALALRFQGRAEPEPVAHFVNQLVFCFFASSVKLLPEGMFQALIARAQKRPKRAKGNLDEMFAQMRTGGEFALQDIAHFNGGLFDGQPALEIDQGDADLLMQAAKLDWAEIDPTIFGTLFERFLDPGKRAQIGAHYTDPAKIMMIVEPVVLRPLRAEWETARAGIAAIMEKAAAKADTTAPSRRGVLLAKARQEAEAIQLAFLERLRAVSILDPACGSGNFLYLALQAVKDLEWRAIQEGEGLGLSPRAPEIGPEILRGIEINPLAAELARTTVWIGDIQWRIRNAIYTRPDPILRKLDTIELRDALITRRADGSVVEADWPAAEFIVGNPPFLGGKKLIAGLGAEETETIREVYSDRISPFSDLVCWWFDKARKQIEDGKAKRAGLVATNSIRGGRNRLTLETIQKRLTIFEAWADEPWIVDGASVRVSIVCFAAEPEDGAMLNGVSVAAINPDLTSDLPITTARRLSDNAATSFIGIQKSGPLDIPGDTARALLIQPTNVNGRPNTDVLSPWWIGIDVTRRPRDYWIINFNGFEESAAARYEAPFELLKREIALYEAERGRKITRPDFWRLWRRRPEFFAAIGGLKRFIATPEVAKHRVFVFLDMRIVPDKNLIAIARDDDTTFGILHSRFHEAWSLRLGTSLEDRPRYTPTTTFETYPFPDGLTPNVPAASYADDPRARRIAQAARALDEARGRWLNPPDLVRIEPEVVPGYPDRVLPKDEAAAAVLKERTLTKLYNARPAWLAALHDDLDRAVAAAYGWPEDIGQGDVGIEDALARLLALNLARAAAQDGGPAPETDGED